MNKEMVKIFMTDTLLTHIKRHHNLLQKFSKKPKTFKEPFLDDNGFFRSSKKELLGMLGATKDDGLGILFKFNLGDKVEYEDCVPGEVGKKQTYRATIYNILIESNKGKPNIFYTMNERGVGDSYAIHESKLRLVT